jgi:hypothetical protein
MSDVVLSQLMEAESQLASQETDLMAKIAAIQEKRKGLQTVIGMFQGPVSGNGAAAPSESLVEALNGAAAKASPEPAAKTPAAKTTERKPRAQKSTTVRKAANAGTTTAKRGAVKTGKVANWNRYVQEPFRQTPLPDVVANILQAQPSSVFKIADVMDAIFKEDMPKATFLKARNRVSNILSAGARNKDWARGRGGTYSMSQKALQ